VVFEPGVSSGGLDDLGEVHLEMLRVYFLHEAVPLSGIGITIRVGPPGDAAF